MIIIGTASKRFLFDHHHDEPQSHLESYMLYRHQLVVDIVVLFPPFPSEKEMASHWDMMTY